MSKKHFVLFLMFSQFIFINLIPNQISANELVNRPVAVFYSPHQDDELLTMGHAITHYVQRGYEVHVVLLTDGSNSSSIHLVNNEIKTKYLQPLSKQEFSYARNLEFVRSLKVLGVERENIHFAYFEDGKTTVDEIQNLILQYHSRFPEAEHMAFSYHDDHIDHKNSGIALQNLYKGGIIKEPKLYIQNVERPFYNGTYEPDIEQYQSIIESAIYAYSDWNPLRRMYSIGIISVKGHFDTLKEDPRSKYHRPSQ